MLMYGETNGLRETNGFNKESMIHKGQFLSFVDVGSKMTTEYRSHLMSEVGCLYYFVDGSFYAEEDDLENLFIARNDLMALMMSEALEGVPVAIIHNIGGLQRNSFIAGCGEFEMQKRSFDDLLVGFGIAKLRTWATVFVTDLSYKDAGAVEALLDFTINHTK